MIYFAGFLHLYQVAMRDYITINCEEFFYIFVHTDRDWYYSFHLNSLSPLLPPAPHKREKSIINTSRFNWIYQEIPINSLPVRTRQMKIFKPVVQSETMLITSNYCSHQWFTDAFKLYFSFVVPDPIIICLSYTKTKKEIY